MDKSSKITKFFKSDNKKKDDSNLDSEKTGKDVGNQVLNTDYFKNDRTEERTFFDKPNQPVINFPKNKQNRKFQANWYTKFSWLEYDISRDAAFCFICKQYRTFENEKCAFKLTGFNNWHNATNTFSVHENTESHKTNTIRLLNRINIEKNGSKSCASQLNSQHAKEVEANRKYLIHTIQVIHFLAKQGLAFRGNNENEKTSKNMGNFLELMKFHQTMLPELQQFSESKIAKYTSPTIQNEIINLISKQIINSNLPSKFYAIICDETMDLSRKEMLALCLRKVDDDLNVHENFFGFYRAKIQSADGIFNLIKSVLEEELNLDTQHMVAQSFDGAATMARIKTGVAKRFTDLIPHAVFVHCYAHKLNLALQDATNKLKAVSDVLLIVQNVSVFVERSAKRHTLFEHLQGDEKKATLHNFCATRWSSRYLALKSFVKLYKYLLTFLEIVDDDNDKTIGAAARGFLKQVKNFDFVFYCNVLLILFEKTHMLSKFLQMPNNNIVQALELCDVTILDLNTMKNNYIEILESVKKICEEEYIDTVLEPISKKRKNYSLEVETNADKYKKSFNHIIDVYISELQIRFSKNEFKSIIAMYNLIMLKNEKEHAEYNYNDLIKYEKLVDLERLKTENSNFINYKIKFDNLNWKDLNNVIKNFVDNDLKCFYQEIFKLLKIYLTIPISSAEAERAFSVLKLLKTWLRTAMEDDRLSALGIIKMASNMMIDYDLILEEFIKIKERRLLLV